MGELDFNLSWYNLLSVLMVNGDNVSPRGQPTKELPQQTIVVDARRPVLTISERKLSYQFMAAEAYWILTGDYRVETIAPYNKRIHEFSDDGKTFFGAYGPKIANQLDYVVGKLREDPMSRQAGLTIWRENPPHTKDVPCTVAIFFSIRDGKVNAHVFMRSSDAWLGVPYDVFNFSMLTHLICARLNVSQLNPAEDLITPGRIYLTMASSHIYEPHFESADDILATRSEIPILQPETPEELYTNPSGLVSYLCKLRNTKPGDELRWWQL